MATQQGDDPRGSNHRQQQMGGNADTDPPPPQTSKGWPEAKGGFAPAQVVQSDDKKVHLFFTDFASI